MGWRSGISLSWMQWRVFPSPMPTLSDIDGLLGPIGMMQSGLVIFFCVPSLTWIMQLLPKASLVERKTYSDFFKGAKRVYWRECVLKLKTNLPCCWLLNAFSVTVLMVTLLYNFYLYITLFLRLMQTPDTYPSSSFCLPGCYFSSNSHKDISVV